MTEAERDKLIEVLRTDLAAEEKRYRLLLQARDREARRADRAEGRIASWRGGFFVAAVLGAVATAGWLAAML